MIKSKHIKYEKKGKNVTNEHVNIHFGNICHMKIIDLCMSAHVQFQNAKKNPENI